MKQTGQGVKMTRLTQTNENRENEYNKIIKHITLTLRGEINKNQTILQTKTH